MPRISYSRQHHDHFLREIWSGPDLPAAGTNASADVIGRMYYDPIHVYHTLTISNLICIHADVAAGNFYQAIYDVDKTTLPWSPRNRRGVTASTAVTGTFRRQCTPLVGGNLQLEPDAYFITLEPDNLTDSYYRMLCEASRFQPVGTELGLFVFSELLGAYVIPPAAASATQVGGSDVWSLGAIVTSVP